MSRTFPRTALVAISALLFACASSFAQTAKETKPVTSQVPPQEKAASQAAENIAHPLTAADLEPFLDGLLPAQIEREDIAGAVVAVVKDGNVLFAKGYGYSDLKQRKPVSPGDTLFRPGSISKLFTWTSVMQLVEQGKLDLDLDVNDYLDFKIPPAFGKPITLRNIMTHTPGFEESGKELFVADASRMRPLSEYLKEHVPARIFPPGTTPAYSNYATALAGYIVERVSGKPFMQYVADNILTPLGMKHTTFVQPLPPDLEPLMSKGYVLASEGAKPYEFVQAFPAGSVATSALDMCNFMIAHLQDGKFGQVQILRPETAREMHSRQFAADSRLNGMALGFYEESRNGHRIIGHGGDTVYFHSDLHLLLDANIGFFISYNSRGKGEISPRTVIFEKFLDRYFPYTPPAPEKVENPKKDVAEVAGVYMTSRRPESNFLRMLTLFEETKVFPNPDGTISVDFAKDPSGALKHFEEIRPMLFREVHGQDHVAFHRDAAGNLEFSVDWPIFVFQRASLGVNKNFNYAILIPSVILIVFAVLLWPIAACTRWHYGRRLELSQPQKRMRLAVRLICLLNLAVLIAWVVFISMADNPAAFSRSLDPLLYLIQIAGVLCVAGALLVLLNAVQGWSAAGKWIWAKIFDTALAFGCLGLAWFLWHWNLINFNLKY